MIKLKTKISWATLACIHGGLPAAVHSSIYEYITTGQKWQLFIVNSGIFQSWQYLNISALYVGYIAEGWRFMICK